MKHEAAVEHVCKPYPSQKVTGPWIHGSLESELDDSSSWASTTTSVSSDRKSRYAKKAGVRHSPARFVLVSMTTLGYGDITPATNPGTLVTFLLVITGVFYMSMPLGMIGEPVRGSLKPSLLQLLTGPDDCFTRAPGLPTWMCNSLSTFLTPQIP